MLTETDEASGVSTISVVDFLDAEWGYRPSGVMSARAEVTREEEDMVDVALLNYAIQFESSQCPGPSRSIIVHLEFASSQMLP